MNATMSAALLLIVVLPFVQILIQRLRRQVEEPKRQNAFKNNTLQHESDYKIVNEYNILSEKIPFPEAKRDSLNP